MSLDFLKPAPYQPITKTPEEVRESYRYWRIRICYSIFLGYVAFYFTRKGFASVMPFMMDDLGFTKAQLGILSTILSITYGISKLIGGIMSDKSNPRYFMAIGLIATGILNIFFAFASSIWVFALFWGLNGWFQAWGWPACCKQLNYWFEQKERGFWYSVCSTSHNVGAALLPILIVYVAVATNWRFAMFAPAIISIVMGLVLINRLRDVPRSLGLPTVEEFKNQCQSNSCLPDENTQHDTKHISLGVREILFKHVLNNKYIWIFALSYFFVYLVRTAIHDWTPLYLKEAKGIGIVTATWGVFFFEGGGLLGQLAAGWGSDYFWKGNRVPVMILCAIGLIISLFGLRYIPANFMYLNMAMLAMIGFFVYGPQMIVGLAAAEYVDKRAAASSNGFAGTIGYLGSAVAGYPLGKMLDVWGWHPYITVLFLSSAMIFILLLPLWSNNNGEKKMAKQKKSWIRRRQLEGA
ncbi:MAG: MFS transporter [Candidatus Berkiellales bacterium]